MRKKIVTVLFTLTACLVGYGVVSDFCHKQTKGFSVGKITRSSSLECFIEEKDVEQALAALDQPFHYLKKGNSAYVFLSADEKYVIKFLRSPKILPPFWMQWSVSQAVFPSFYKEILSRRSEQKEIQLTSYRLAAGPLVNQTGLFYAHLHTTSSLKKNITFYDRLKIKHSLPADTTAFLLQRKAEAFCPYFIKLIAEKKEHEISFLLQEFASFLQERATCGIFDNDISPHYNLGVLDGHLMAFDLDGLKLCKTPPSDLLKHMLHDGKKMLLWLEGVEPSLARFLEKEIKNRSIPSYN